MQLLYDKQTVLDYLWMHSRFNAVCLYQSEELYRLGKGFSAITVLFNCLENVSKSVINDYDSTLQSIFTKLHDQKIIADDEHDFLNIDDNCIRKVRNLYAHANIYAKNLVSDECGKDVLLPLSEDDTSLFLYRRISDIIFNLILKIISSGFVDEVKKQFEFPLKEYISECNLRIKTLTVQELLIMKGYPEDYISDTLNIPEEAKYRMIDNAPDVNIYSLILSHLPEAKSDE